MRILFLVLFLAFEARADESVFTSSNAFFGSNSISSATATIVPSTTNVFPMTGKIVEILFKNMSSSMPIFFSTSEAVAFNIDNGFSISPLETLAVPWGPQQTYSTHTATRFFFVREGGGTAADGVNIGIRSWVRYRR